MLLLAQLSHRLFCFSASLQASTKPSNAGRPTASLATTASARAGAARTASTRSTPTAGPRLSSRATRNVTSLRTTASPLPPSSRLTPWIAWLSSTFPSRREDSGQTAPSERTVSTPMSKDGGCLKRLEKEEGEKRENGGALCLIAAVFLKD